MRDLSVMRIRGVYTHPNRMSEVPEGALARADGCVIDRESLLEPRRGMPRYGDDILSASTAISRVFPFDGRLVAHHGTTLAHDDGAGTWTDYATALSVPESGFRVRDEIANGSLYLTSSVGIRKIDDVDGDHVAAGVHSPLDGTGALSGSSGFLANASATGYRATLYTTDANGFEVESAPSQRLVVPNSAGGTRDVDLTWYLPSGLTTDHYWRIYRSTTIAGATSSPSDELQLVAEGRLTSTDISNGYVTTTDSTPDDLRGANLYTNPSEEGIAQANEQPPLARDMCMFEGHMFYANVTGKHRFFLSLLGVGSTALRFVSETGNTSIGSSAISGIGTTAAMRAGMRIIATGFTTAARILTVDSASQITASENATANGTGVSVETQDIVSIAGREYYAGSSNDAANRQLEAETSGTASQNIEDTCANLIRAVNADASSTVYAFYDSGFDDVPGKLRIQERGVGGSSFQVASTAAEAWSPTLPATENGSQVSNATRRANSVGVSKPDQPDAVPLGQLIRCRESDVKRVLALRDAVYVLSDEIGRISGTDFASFDYQVLDRTAKIIGPETAVVINDGIMCNSTQGVIRITQSGVQVISRSIEVDIRRASAFTNYASLAFAVAYETDRSYLLFEQAASGDTAPTECWRYNAFTNAWTRPFDIPATAGCVDPTTDRLVLVDDQSTKARRERKSYDRTDYADAELSVTVASSSGSTLTLVSATGVSAGWVIVQGDLEAKVTAVDGNALTMDEELDWEAAAATAYEPITVTFEPVPIVGGDANRLKHFPEVGFILREAEFKELTVAFATNFYPNFDRTLTLRTKDTGGTWGTPPWGDHPWGAAIRDEQPVRALVPVACQRAHWLRMSVQVSICREKMAVAGYGVAIRELGRRFRGAVNA